MFKICQIWAEECEVATAIKAEFGTDKALNYLIGEKFVDFLEAADNDPAFRAEISAFVAEIKTIFARWQLAEYLKNGRETEPFDPAVHDDEDTADLENTLDIRQGAAGLSLRERARDWLLGEGE